MKVYHGRREEHGCAVDVEEDGEACLLDPRYDLHNHASEDLEWGSFGTGAAQLALARAADVLGDDARALRVHQRLKARLVATLPDDDWVLTEGRVRAVIDAIELEHGRRR